MRFSVLIEFFSVLDDFFYDFVVSNGPQCPPSFGNVFLMYLGLNLSTCLVVVDT